MGAEGDASGGRPPSGNALSSSASLASSSSSKASSSSRRPPPALKSKAPANGANHLPTGGKRRPKPLINLNKFGRRVESKPSKFCSSFTEIARSPQYACKMNDKRTVNRAYTPPIISPDINAIAPSIEKKKRLNNSSFRSSSSTSRFTPVTPAKAAKTFSTSRVFEDGILWKRFRKPPSTCPAISTKIPRSRRLSMELMGSAEYEVLGRIGSGSYGDVYKVRRSSVRTKGDGGEEVGGEMASFAVKRSRRPIRSDKERKEVLGELRALAAMTGSPFCVRYFKSWEHQGYLCILMEMCDRGTLEELLLERELKEPTIWAFMSDMVLGVSHIHQKGIIHLDLKPANMFIAANGKLKIGDFGIAMKESTGQQTRRQRNRLERDGDPVYLAPEALDRTLLEGGKGAEQGASGVQRPSLPADIFSLGVILLEMVADVRLPPNGVEWHRLRNNEIACLEDVRHSNEVKALVRKCMQRRPESRPTADQLANQGAGGKSLDDAIAMTKECPVRSDVSLPAIKAITRLDDDSAASSMSLSFPSPRRLSLPARSSTDSMILSPLRERSTIEGRKGKPPFPAATTTALPLNTANNHRKDLEAKISEERGYDPEPVGPGREVAEGHEGPGHGVRKTIVTELEEEEVLSDTGNG
eukprot:jgi/Bigna1/68165/fgenesh1_pg.5_\